MPLYEYQCDGCGHRFEAIQKFSDPPLETCPKCGAAIRKLQSAPAIQFKGAGWYITDYAKKDGSPAAAGKKGGESAAAGEAPAAKSGSDSAAAPSPAGSSSATPAAAPAASSPKSSTES